MIAPGCELAVKWLSQGANGFDIIVGVPMEIIMYITTQ